MLTENNPPVFSTSINSQTIEVLEELVVYYPSFLDEDLEDEHEIQVLVDGGDLPDFIE